MYEDTIAAVVTAPGEAGVGVIRLSGPRAVAIGAAAYSGRAELLTAAGHTVHYGRVVEPQSGRVLDEALFLVMRAPKSFTGEDVVEIQCHGGPVVLGQILRLLVAQGARLAEAGEYSKRAFLNGKLDLAQAEAIMDIVSAKTDKGLAVAMAQREGGLSQQVRSLREQLLELIAFIQADIDYPDDDIERLTQEEQLARVDALQERLESLLATAGRGRLIKDGVKTVIAGKPNVGKSSLLNALLGQQRAIVTDIPGTTRDVIEETISLQGVPLRIMDTAGIRETENLVERLGVDMARELLQAADLVLYVFELAEGLGAEDERILAALDDAPVVFLRNKMDLAAGQGLDERTQRLIGERPLVELSALQGQGLDELERVIVQLVFGGEVSVGHEGLVTNVRHEAILREAHEHLQSFQEAARAGLAGDLLVIDLQSAWEKLGSITGETVEDDLLDQIFSKFCLGK